MSQTYDIGLINPTTTSPLTDITRLTNGMEALRTLFSGPTTPTDTSPYMFWADTTAGLLKRRNANNDGWLVALSLTEDFINVITGTYTTVASDSGTMILADATASDIIINLVAASTAGAGSFISIKKTDLTTNKVILTPNASELIDDHDDYILQAHEETIILRSTGNNWVIVNLYLPVVVLDRSSDYTVVRADDKAVFAVDATSGDVTIDLPAVADINNGFSVTIKKIDSTVNTVTVDGNVNETIDGVLTKVLSEPNQTIVLVNDGSNWLVVSEVSASVAFATNAQMAAGTNGLVSVSPGNIKFSPFSTQVQLHYNLVAQTIISQVGVSDVLVALNGVSFVVVYDDEFASLNSHTVVASGGTVNAIVAPMVMVDTLSTTGVQIFCFSYSLTAQAATPAPLPIVTVLAAGVLAT